MEIEVPGSGPRDRTIVDHFFRFGNYDVSRVPDVGTPDSYTGVNVSYNLMSIDNIVDWHGHYFHDTTSKWFAYGDNNVEHTQIRVHAKEQVRTIPVIARTVNTTYYYNPRPDSLLGTPDRNAVGLLFPSPPSSLLDDLRRKACRRFMSQIPIEVDGIPFLAELHEVTELVPRLLSTISETVASGWLQWNFGCAPLLSDLRKISQIVSTVEDRLQFLMDTWGKKTQLHFKRSKIWDPPFLPFYALVGDPPFTGRAVRRFYQADFQASAWLTHHLEGLRDKLAELRAIGVALGFTNIAGAIWEEIPFSFVVDWLIDVGSVLDETAITNIFRGDWWVRRPVQSVTVTGRLSLEQFARWNFVTGYTNPTHLSSMHVRRYTRWAGMPDAPSLFDLGSLSPKQASLLLAIAAGSRA
jgi:hypothetical protein